MNRFLARFLLVTATLVFALAAPAAAEEKSLLAVDGTL